MNKIMPAIALTKPRYQLKKNTNLPERLFANT